MEDIFPCAVGVVPRDPILQQVISPPWDSILHWSPSTPDQGLDLEANQVDLCILCCHSWHWKRYSPVLNELPSPGGQKSPWLLELNSQRFPEGKSMVSIRGIVNHFEQCLVLIMCFWSCDMTCKILAHLGESAPARASQFWEVVKDSGLSYVPQTQSL